MIQRTWLAIAPVCVLTLAACDDDPKIAPEPPLIYTLSTRDPARTPIDPLAGSAVESCAVFQEEKCETGIARRCNVYDTGSDSFVPFDAIEPLTRRALLFDRWYDLYHQPDGQTAIRYFNIFIAPNTPDTVWGDPALFSRFGGMGDSAIWSGTALNAYIQRYLSTGTEADYQRMEEKVRWALTMFDVTGMRGYLARYHFLDLPTGAPLSDAHVFTYNHTYAHKDYVVTSPETIEGLPQVYLTGVDDAGDTHWEGVPSWHGSPSIDQYSGMTTSLPAAWALLRDADLKNRIADHLTCYLKRLIRIEVVNLQQSPDVLDALAAAMETSDTNLDPGDVEIASIDSFVMYVLPQPNELNSDWFDPSCPDTIAMVPSRVIDATTIDFEFDLIGLVLDLGGRDSLRENGIDHFYVPNLRGADAIHLMHLAAMAYHFTGDIMYRDFVEDELIENLDVLPVAHMFSAVMQPKWCRKWYGSHISIAPLWAFINLLDDSPLRDEVVRVMYEEAWLKDAARLGSAKFALMFAGTADAKNATAQAAAFVEGMHWVTTMGGNGGELESSRRSYTVAYDDVVTGMQTDNAVTCPDAAMVAACEESPELFGFALGGLDITAPCTGALGECEMPSGECARPLTANPLPLTLRPFTDFLWQRNPHAIGFQTAAPGHDQSAGVDVVESYWLARRYGQLPEADNLVLAWQEKGVCP